MVSKEEVLSITRQCQLLDLSRSACHYAPEPVSKEEPVLMKLIDQRCPELAFYRSRRVIDSLYDKHTVLL